MKQYLKLDQSHHDFSSGECEISHPMAKPQSSEYFEALTRLMPTGLKHAAWARAAGLSSSFFQDVKKGSRPRYENLVKILAEVGATVSQYNALLTTAEPFPTGDPVPPPEDNVRDAEIPFRHRSNALDVPIYGTAEGAQLFVGEQEIETTTIMPDEIVDYIRRPIGVAERRSVYALYVVGTSMETRWFDGEPIFVDPTRTPAIGDHVVVQLLRRDEDGNGEVWRVMVKRLVKRLAEAYELQQYNPKLTFRIDKADVAVMHRVIPPNELHGI